MPARSLMLLAALLPLPALAQLKPAPPPTATRPVSLPAPPPARARASDDDGQAEANQRLRERLQPTPAPARPAQPTSRPAAALPVYDRNGRRLEGMRQAGPGRVMDTRTGRYYDTTPSGDGQRIVERDGS